MFKLIHGENANASRNELQRIRSEFSGEILIFSAKETSPEILAQNLTGSSLFNADKKLLVIENFSANSALFENISVPSTNIDIIFWEGKSLTQTQIKTLQKSFPSLTEQEFKIDPIVFKFLDCLEPRNTKQNLKYWTDYKTTEVPEIISVMLVRQFRLLLLAKDPAASDSPDWARLSPWQKQKINSQASKFSTEILKKCFARLADIDYRSKTSQTPLDLQGSLELFLLSL